MKQNRILNKLEHDLSHFLIEENCKNDPTKRGSSEMYRYRGLSITVDTKNKSKDEVVSIRIGALEADFKLNSGEKTSGNLFPGDEDLIMIWLSQSENSYALRNIFASSDEKIDIAIIPFDLEEFYANK